MITSMVPRKISTRIVVLILFILMSNAVLTGIFSQQYHIQQGQVKTYESLHAVMNYLSVHGTPEKIGQILESSDIQHIQEPPSTIALSKNHELNKLSRHFNHGNTKSSLSFYEDIDEPKILYIAYKSDGLPIYWIMMPQEPIEQTGIIIAYFEEFIIVFIIFMGSYFTARTINAPLEKIRRSLNLFGSGSIPPPVEEEGPSEIKQLAHSVNQMIINHNALDKERELMLAGISHDLRTPLTRLQLLAELSTASRETIDAIKEEIDQITKMQQQFIDYVAASTHEQEDFVHVFEFCQDFANKYKLSGNEIQILNHASHDLVIKTQPIGLYRILLNAVNNAIKYGEPPFCIEIREDAHFVILNILDAGNGVSENTLQEIFKPLYRGNSARKNADGSGLGLAIVSRIVKRLGGQIHAYNVPPKGFCLNIVLPKA